MYTTVGSRSRQGGLGERKTFRRRDEHQQSPQRWACACAVQATAAPATSTSTSTPISTRPAADASPSTPESTAVLALDPRPEHPPSVLPRLRPSSAAIANPWALARICRPPDATRSLRIAPSLSPPTAIRWPACSTSASTTFLQRHPVAGRWLDNGSRAVAVPSNTDVVH